MKLIRNTLLSLVILHCLPLMAQTTDESVENPASPASINLMTLTPAIQYEVCALLSLNDGTKVYQDSFKESLATKASSQRLGSALVAYSFLFKKLNAHISSAEKEQSLALFTQYQDAATQNGMSTYCGELLTNLVQSGTLPKEWLTESSKSADAHIKSIKP